MSLDPNGVPSMAAIQDAIDEVRPRVGQAGLPLAGATTGEVAVVFEQPFQTGVLPVVTVTPIGTDARLTTSVGFITNTGFKIFGYFPEPLSLTVPVGWFAAVPT